MGLRLFLVKSEDGCGEQRSGIDLMMVLTSGEERTGDQQLSGWMLMIDVAVVGQKCLSKWCV